MKVSHILYKVDNLENAVKAYEKKGFHVEYGKKENPINALIYFSEGPYLELLHTTGMPKFVKLMMRFFGQKKMVDRVNYWENASEGLLDLCLETYEVNMDSEMSLLDENNESFFIRRGAQRNDVHGRNLVYDVSIPHNLKLPFMMTYFSEDPKPKDFVHPNGITSIQQISFGTDKSLFPLMKALCDDPILNLYEGLGIKNLVYKNQFNELVSAQDI